MEFYKIEDKKEDFLPLLLLADESEDMIKRYLDRGDMYALYDQGIKTVCIVTDEGNGVIEIKNIATFPEAQRLGYGKAMISYIENIHKGSYRTLQVGTGDSPLTIPFYESCGFKRSHIIKNFFVDNYPNAIIEAGVQLMDMVYLRKDIK